MLTTIKLYAQNLQKKRKEKTRGIEGCMCDGRGPAFEDMMIDIITVIISTKKIKNELKIPPN